MKIKESIEIPFGTKDSELKGWEYTIPEGYEARIEGNKVILKPKESEDEQIRKWIVDELKDSLHNIETLYSRGDYDNRDKDDIIREDLLRKALAWVERQGERSCHKFNVGDVVRHKNGSRVTITGIDEEERCYYYKTYDGAAILHSDFGFGEECNWELIKRGIWH